MLLLTTLNQLVELPMPSSTHQVCTRRMVIWIYCRAFGPCSRFKANATRNDPASYWQCAKGSSLHEFRMTKRNEAAATLCELLRTAEGRYEPMMLLGLRDISCDAQGPR